MLPRLIGWGKASELVPTGDRWRKVGLWDRLKDAVTKASDGQVRMTPPSSAHLPKTVCDIA